MKKINSILLKLKLLFLYILVVNTSTTKQSSLIKLNKENYRKIIEESDTILIIFYEKSCGRCKQFENAIKEAIEILQIESTSQDYEVSKSAKLIIDKVKFATINGYKNKHISEEFEIEAFPSIRFIRPKFGIISELTTVVTTKIFSPRSVINYLKKRLVKDWVEIDSIEKLKEINKENQINLLVCDHYTAIQGPKASSVITSIIDRLIIYYEDIHLTHVTISPFELEINNTTIHYDANPTLLNYLDCSENKPQLILYKQFDEKEVRYSNKIANWTEELIEDFMVTYTSPLIVEFNNDNLQSVIQKGIPAIIYFYKEELPMSSYSIFYDSSKLYRKQILFLKGEISNEFSVPMIEMMDIKEVPTVVGLKILQNDVKKYKMDGTRMIKESLNEFIEGFLSESLPKYIISENSNFSNPFYLENIYKLTGENFDKLLTNQKCFLIYPYMDNYLPQIYDTLQIVSSKYLKNSDIKIGMIDLGLNEVLIEKTKSVILFKENNFLHMEGGLSVKIIVKFLIQHNCFEDITEDKIAFDNDDEEEIVLDNPFDHFENPEHYYNNSEDIKEQIVMINEKNTKTNSKKIDTNSNNDSNQIENSHTPNQSNSHKNHNALDINDEKKVDL